MKSAEDAAVLSIAAALEGGGYGLASSRESALQEAARQRLLAAGLNVRSEHTSGSNRFDLRVQEGTIVEVKVDGGTDRVRAQLERYAQDPTVTGIVLLTSMSKHRGLGHEINGKKVVVAYAIRF